MAKKSKEEKIKIGWAAEREPKKDEGPIKTLTTEKALDGLAEKVTARSGPRYAPGIGKSS
jgi:hypothetical protein